MVVVFNDINRTFKGLADLRLKRLSDGLIWCLPTPSTFAVDNGIEQKIQMTRNQLGEMTRAGSYISGRTPTLRVSYQNMQPEILQFRIGNYFAAKTNTELALPKSVDVFQNEYAGALNSTQLGFTITADTVTQATTVKNNASVLLTQQPFGSFSAATDDSFAVGDAGALKFSNNLKTAAARVSLLIPYTINTYGIGSQIVGPHSLFATLITTEGEVVVFTCRRVTPNFEGSGFDTGAESIELPFFINSVAGQCQSYELDYTGVYVSC
jgi:hypothetical protein